MVQLLLVFEVLKVGAPILVRDLLWASNFWCIVDKFHMAYGVWFSRS